MFYLHSTIILFHTESTNNIKMVYCKNNNVGMHISPSSQNYDKITMKIAHTIMIFSDEFYFQYQYCHLTLFGQRSVILEHSKLYEYAIRPDRCIYSTNNGSLWMYHINKYYGLNLSNVHFVIIFTLNVIKC